MAGGSSRGTSLAERIAAAPARNTRPESCWVCMRLSPDDRQVLDQALVEQRVSQARLAVVLQEAGYADARESRIQSHWSKHVKAR